MLFLFFGKPYHEQFGKPYGEPYGEPFVRTRFLPLSYTSAVCR